MDYYSYVQKKMIPNNHDRMKGPPWRSAIPFLKKNGVSNGDKWIEKRLHKRYQLKGSSFVVATDLIDKRYQIIDISKGGLSFWYISEKEPFPDLDSLDITLEDSIKLDAVSVRTVYDTELVKCAFIPIAMRKRGVCFRDLKAPKKSQIENFINTCDFNEEMAKIFH
jgi:hypothetical protein